MPRPANCGQPDRARTPAMLAVQKPQPADASGEQSYLRCPFCDATDVQLVSLFGSQLLMSQYQCGACRGYFEAVRPEPEEHGGQAQR